MLVWFLWWITFAVNGLVFILKFGFWFILCGKAKCTIYSLVAEQFIFWTRRKQVWPPATLNTSYICTTAWLDQFEPMSVYIIFIGIQMMYHLMCTILNWIISSYMHSDEHNAKYTIYSLVAEQFTLWTRRKQVWPPATLNTSYICTTAWLDQFEPMSVYIIFIGIQMMYHLMCTILNWIISL